MSAVLETIDHCLDFLSRWQIVSNSPSNNHNTVQQHQGDETIKRCKNCDHLQQLLHIMGKYNHCKNQKSIPSEFINNVNILQIFNNYTHLIHHHDDDAQFEFIVDTLDDCTVTECMAFQRNNRDRNKVVNDDKKSDDSEEINVVSVELLDRIHCYFQHCLDIGYRLYAKDKKLINHDDDGKSVDNVDSLFKDPKLIKLNQILHQRREKCKTLDVELRNSKYNQLYDDANKQQNEKTCTTNENMYSFGFVFNYGDDEYNEGINVSSKYSTLKDELISNCLSTLSVDQFQKEYAKCEIHYNSNYCKTEFRPFVSKDRHKTRMKKTENIPIECILSLMVYCNFDQLQNEFSKTYRTNNGIGHNEFYWLGKNLKVAIHKFGTRIVDGNEKTFYHGVSEQLLFPSVGHPDEYGVIGVYINSPLSTSTSFPVAMNFTNNNNGLIVQFGGWKCKYFSVAWLSDYGNENEHLFIQNCYVSDKLQMENIFDVKLGYEYCAILEALNIISTLTSDLSENTNVGAILKTSLSPQMADVIVKIIKYQLSATISSYKISDDLSIYVKKSIKIHFNKTTWVELDYQIFEDIGVIHLKNLFFASNAIINLKEIGALFPDIKTLNIKNINLSSSTMEYMIGYLLHDNAVQFNKICIEVVCPDSNITVNEAIKHYKQQFVEAQFNIKSEMFVDFSTLNYEEKLGLCIEKV